MSQSPSDDDFDGAEKIPPSTATPKLKQSADDFRNALVAIGKLTTKDPEASAARVVSEPFRAWKLGYVVQVQVAGKFRFRAMAHVVNYETNAVAICMCHLGATHQLPRMNTQCGFYAMRERDAVEAVTTFPDGGGYVHQDMWLMEVDLYGRVVRCANGYRAEKQRVLSIRPFHQPQDYIGELVSNWAWQHGGQPQANQHYHRLLSALDAGHLMSWGESNTCMGKGTVLYGLPAFGHCLDRVQTMSMYDLSAELGTEVRAYDGPVSTRRPMWRGSY